MSKRKLTKRELRERQIFEDQKFNRTLLISFGSLFVLIILYLVFHVFWHDAKYAYRQYALYGKQVPAELVCMNGDKLINHKSIKLSYKGKNYFFCNKSCYNHLVNYFSKDAFTFDPFSGDTICKADALIGLRNLGEPEIIYFQNIKTFNKYYKSKDK
jgi:YHS domain-containing protein